MIDVPTTQMSIFVFFVSAAVLFDGAFSLWVYLIYKQLCLYINCRPQGRQKLLSSCVNIWSEAHKICKAWVLINQILPRYFCSYGLWLNKSDIESDNLISASQPILTNQYPRIDFIQSKRWFFLFSHNPS